MKLFEEIARSLRLVKGDHQPEVLEPQTRTSAPEFEIIVPSDAAARDADFSPDLRDTIRVIRHDVLATLRQMPGFVSAAQKMAREGCLYRVLVSEEHVHLLREGADGIVKPFLRDAHGQFVENVDLIRVPPDFAGEIAAIAINAALAEISAKLDVVATSVENLAELMRVANLGGLQGAIRSAARPMSRSGTESSWTLCWREMDSNSRYRDTKAVDLRSIPGIAGDRRGS